MDEATMERIDARLSHLEARLRVIEIWAGQSQSERQQAATAPSSGTTPAQGLASASSRPTSATPPSLPLHPPPVAAVAAAASPVTAPVSPTTQSGALSPQKSASLPAQSAVKPVAAQPGGSASAPGWSLDDLEQILSGRGLAWLGGLAILIGAIFFLGLAFRQGWVGPSARVTIGLVAGTLLFGIGAWFFERKEALFGHVLVATGLGTIGISLTAATRLYQLLPVEVGLLMALVTAIGAAAIAIRAGSQVVAAYGLVTSLAAPPLLGADPTLTTIAFLATAMSGTTLIALYRSWSWLPLLAFTLVAPQLADWLFGSAPLGIGFVVLGGFWVLNTLAAGGEEFRLRRLRLHPSSATLLVASAAFLVANGFALLDGTYATSRGIFLVVVAWAHWFLGAYFLARDGDQHPFGMLAFGTGIAALTMAIPVQLGGPVVPIAWAAEAVALAWVYTRRSHRYSGLAAIVLGALAVIHLVTVEYPIDDLARAHNNVRPFLNAAGGTLGFILLALAVAFGLVKSRAIRGVLAAVSGLLVIYALPHEVAGLVLLGGWAGTMVVAMAISRRLGATSPGGGTARPELALPWVALLGGLLAHLLALSTMLSPEHIGMLPATPFSSRSTVAALILIAVSLASGYLHPGTQARRIANTWAWLIAAYLMPFELPATGVVVAWSALALGLCWLARSDRTGSRLYVRTAGGVIVVALFLIFSTIAPLDRLALSAARRIDHPLLWSGASAALGAVIVALVGASRLLRDARWSCWLPLLAGALAVYLLSVGLADEFQRRVDGPASLRLLQKQAQVALSILWAVLGGAGFVLGVARWHAMLRGFGLAMLALATGKVFLYDLAALDATYKVPSFIGLGLLLLLSSFVYQRLRPQPTQGGAGDSVGSGQAPEESKPGLP